MFAECPICIISEEWEGSSTVWWQYFWAGDLCRQRHHEKFHDYIIMSSQNNPSCVLVLVDCSIQVIQGTKKIVCALLKLSCLLWKNLIQTKRELMLLLLEIHMPKMHPIKSKSISLSWQLYRASSQLFQPLLGDWLVYKQLKSMLISMKVSTFI